MVDDDTRLAPKELETRLARLRARKAEEGKGGAVIATNGDVAASEALAIAEELLQEPLEAQRGLAIQLKLYMDQLLKSELREYGKLSSDTRRWVVVYNAILESLHKNVHGEQLTVRSYSHVTHSDISREVRDNLKIIDAAASEVNKTIVEKEYENDSGDEGEVPK